MYELTIADSAQNITHLEKLKEQLMPYIEDSSGVIILNVMNGYSYLSLAVQEENKNIIKSITLDFVARIIVDTQKKEWLNDLIVHGFTSRQNRQTLISALSEFDKDTDIELCKKNLVFDDYINMLSVFAFKMQELKSRWDDIAQLVNNNLPNLAIGDALVDMMKFLLSSIKPKTPEVYIIDNGEEIALINGSKLPDTTMRFNKNAENIEQEILESLILLLPNKIYITDKLYSKLTFMKRIEKLFEGRVYKTW